MFGKRERMPCGCKVGKPRLDCPTHLILASLRDSLARARAQMVYEMHPELYMRHLKRSGYFD